MGASSAELSDRTGTNVQTRIVIGAESATADTYTIHWLPGGRLVGGGKWGHVLGHVALTGLASGRRHVRDTTME